MELQIQKAIELSLASAKPAGSEEGEEGTPPPVTELPSGSESANGSAASKLNSDRELELAIQLSEKELERHKQKQEEEDETLKRVLALSLDEK